jgi:hypothetical protein
VAVGVVGERGGQEWESSSLFTGCCGRRGAVGENDGVGRFSAFKLLPPCSMGSRATCHFVVNVSILVQTKQRGLPLWKHSSVAKERSMRSVCATNGHVFSFFSKETAKGPDQNRYGREGAQGSKGSISVATQQHKQKQKLTRSKWMRASHVGLPHENIKTRRKKLDCT